MADQTPEQGPSEEFTDQFLPQPSDASEGIVYGYGLNIPGDGDQDSVFVEEEAADASLSEFIDSEALEGQSERDIRKTMLAVGSLALGATALGLWGFELGPWNETLRAEIGFEVFVRTLSEFRVAAAVGAFTLALEFATSSLIVAGLNSKNMPGRKGVEWLSQKLSNPNEDEEGPAERDKTDIMADSALAFAAGAGVIAAKRHFTEPDLKPSEEIKSNVVYSSIVAAQSTVLAFLIAGGIKHAATADRKLDELVDKFESTSPLEPSVLTDHIYLENWSRWLTDHGTDQRIWMGLFAVLWLSKAANRDLIKSSITTKFGKNPENDDTVANSDKSEET